MKTKLLSLLIAGAVVSGSAAQSNGAFNGFGVGAGIGWTYNTVKVDPKGFKGVKGNKSLFPLGIFINYMYSSPNSLLWALEAGFDYDLGKDIKFKDSDDGAIDGSELKAKKGFTAMLTPKVGWNFQDNFAAYILVGLGGTSWKVSSANKNDTKFYLAAAPGFGFETDLGGNVKVGMEYKYVVYQKKDRTVNGVKITTTPSASDLRVRLSYNFGNPN